MFLRTVQESTLNIAVLIRITLTTNCLIGPETYCPTINFRNRTL
jgi:hypothetical protein